jgi:hypothetical protein
MNENEPLNNPVTPSNDAVLQPQASSGIMPMGSAPVLQPAPKRRRKGLLIGGIVAGALVLLGGGGVLAYNLWYQNPDKVVHDAIIGAMKAKTVQGTGNFVVKIQENYTLNLAFDGKAAGTDGFMHVKAKFDIKDASQKMSIELEGSGMIKDDVMYVKLDGVRKLFDTMAAQMPVLDAQSMKQVLAIIDKIDSQWVSIKASDYEDISKEVSKQQTCVSDAMKKLQQDDAATDEITNLYREHQIVQVKEKLGSKDGSLGYIIELSQENTAAFVDGLQNTAYGKELKKCDDSLDFSDIAESITNAEAASEKDKAHIELWVSRFGHDITKFSIDGKSEDGSVTAVVEPEFNKDISIEAPKDVVSLKELMKDIEELVKSYSADMYGAPEVDTLSIDSRTNFN